jgi:hypothetical protein
MALAIAMHLCAKAQHTTKQWVSGTLSNYTSDFSSGSLLTTNLNIPVQNFITTSAAIGGADSNLLFYTNGTAIYNNLHLKIKNGDTLNPNANTLAYINNGQYLPQGVVFIPDPGDTNLFYLFHHGKDSTMQCANFIPGDNPNKLYYTLIDKSLNNGKGEVISKNNVILNEINGWSIMAVKHGNGRDWWIVVKHQNQPIWFTFLVSDKGVQGPFQQSIGTGSCLGYWSLKYSSLTNKVVGFRSEYIVGGSRFMDIYDFDRCTGQFSNMQIITVNHSNFMVYAGACEVSPNGRFLYAAVWDILYQYDLTAPNIAASRITVDSVSYNDFLNYKGWFLMQTAPDGKIYNVSRPSNNHYSVINYPDSLGLACNAVVASVLLPAYHNSDVPNIPLYELGPLAGSACDTLLWTGISIHPKGGDMGLVVYPNPTNENIVLNLDNNNVNYLVKILDVIGNTVLEKTVTPFSPIDISELKAGVYIAKVQLNTGVFTAKFTVVR